MKRIFKRVSAAVTALAVVLTAFVFDVPGKMIAAAADHPDHAVCGDASCTEHTTISDWTGISDFNSVSSGNYYLTADVTLTNRIEISENVDITLCLNGHTITATGSNNIFYIYGSLTLCDCKGTGTLTGGKTSIGGAVYVYGSDSTFTMYGGTISGNTATVSGGGVYVNNGTFTMYGGAISDNTSGNEGGGVYIVGSSSITATFTMYGGTISGNTATKVGGGVYQGEYVIFTMYGGAISDNTVTNGSSGGVYVFKTFTMNGGTISGNTAANGGGVNIGAGTFTMNGGTISGNTAANNGGGVFVSSYVTFTMNNGAISDNTAANNGGGMVVYGTVTLNRKVDITGNKKSDDSANNVYLYTNKTLTIGDDFSTDSKIGVTTATAPTDCLSGTVDVTGAVASDISGSFTADIAGQRVVYKDSKVQLAPPHTYSDEWSSDATKHWHECTSCDDKTDEAEHTLVDKSDETNHWQECSVCGYKKDMTEHSWGNWSLTTEPTLTTTGTAERKCSCGEKQTKTDVPALTDTTVWTKVEEQHVEPTEEAEGKDVYTSTDYGTVTVVLPSLEHTHEWGGWTIAIKPTLTATGTAQRVCTKNDTHIDTTTLPVLTDTSVWTKVDDKHVEPTEETDGRDVYTSEYGEVTVVLTSLGHTHEWGGWTITIEPTLTKTGAAQRVCTKNDTHIDTTTLPVLTDTSVWTKVDDKHVEPTEDNDGKDIYTSEYGEVTNLLEKLPHTHKFPLTYVPEVKPTKEEGVKEHWHCDSCGKEFEDENGTKEVTADDLKIGKIETEVQAPANVPKPEIATPKDELMAAALTEDEQQKIKKGTGVKIILKVENAAENVSAEDKEKVEAEINRLSNYNLGQYLDITLLKKIGEDQEQKITETNAPITITFELPEGLRGKAEYSVIRVHNGTATVLRDLDSAPDTITIETDKFSTYALTYKEKTTASKPSGGKPGGSYNPSTSTPNESDSSDNTSSDNDNPPEGDSSDITLSENKPEKGDNSGTTSSDDDNPLKGDSSDTTSSENKPANGDNSDDTSSDDGSTASSESDTSNDFTSSSDESNHIPSESSPSEDNGNPSTGMAVSLIPLVTAAAILTVAVKLKKK